MGSFFPTPAYAGMEFPELWEVWAQPDRRTKATYRHLKLKNYPNTRSVNFRELDTAPTPLEIAISRLDNEGLVAVMTNSIDSGGTNASMLMSRYSD